MSLPIVYDIHVKFASNSAWIQVEFSLQTISNQHQHEKFLSKSELTTLADVSYSTFYRYLKSRRKQLSKLGSKLKSKTLRGKALDYVCRDYGITLPKDIPEPVRKHIKFV